MPRDAVSRTANVERTGQHNWVKTTCLNEGSLKQRNLKRNLFHITLIVMKMIATNTHASKEKGRDEKGEGGDWTRDV